MSVHPDAVPVITVDGPSGSGKGTVSQALARELGWHFLDSGSLYRVLAFAALKRGVDLEDEAALVKLVDHLGESVKLPTTDSPAVMFEGVDIGDELRTESSGNAASRVAVLPGVREALLMWQRDCRRPPGLVADGRDMGSVVFQDADLKLFLTASPAVRAERRYKQLKNMGKEVNLGELIEEVEARDRRDANRKASPLLPAEDALIVDNSDMSEQETISRVLELVRSKL